MTSIHVRPARWALPAMIAVASLAWASSPAHADDLTQVVVRGSNTRTIGYDYHTLKPIEESSVTVGVRYDPVTLTTRSGVALLKEAVAEAAIKACSGSDVSTAEYHSCVRRAIENAQPQVARAITEARNYVNG
jgi:UrcA family protein